MSPANTQTASRLRILIAGSLSNLAAPLSTLVTGPLLARGLGPDGRGTAAALLAPLTLAALMFTLGVPDALAYFVASGRLTGGGAKKIAIGGGFICAALACLILFLSAPSLFRGQPQSLSSFDLLLLTLPVTLVFASVRGIAQGRQQFNFVNRERIVSALLRLAALVALVALHALTPALAVWATIISAALASLFLLPALSGGSAVASGKQDLAAFSQYAGSAALATFGGLIVIRLDQVLMVSLTSRAELAYYAVAASLAELPLAVVAACREVAFSLAAERDDPAIIARFCRLTFFAIAITCIAGGIATPIVLPLLFGKNFSPAISMAEVLLVGTVLRAVGAVIGAGLMTIGRTWIRAAIQIAGACLTAFLIFALVPAWGGIGAAVVTTLTYAALAVASLFVYLQSTDLTLHQCLVPTRSDLQDLKSAVNVILARSNTKHL